MSVCHFIARRGNRWVTRSGPRGSDNPVHSLVARAVVAVVNTKGAEHSPAPCVLPNLISQVLRAQLPVAKLTVQRACSVSRGTSGLPVQPLTVFASRSGSLPWRPEAGRSASVLDQSVISIALGPRLPP